MAVEGRKVHVDVGGELARISIFGEFDVPLLTVNAADRIGFKSQRAGNVRIGVETTTVYTSDGTITEVQKRILDSKEMRTLVAFRCFREGEAIHFYRNALVLYARNDDVTVELVAVVSAVANALPISKPQPAPKERYADLPVVLRPLIPLVTEWGISDDEERWQKVKRSRRSTREKLINTVKPLLPALNQYLDGFKGHPPIAACELWDVAEAALEAQRLESEKCR
jgi:hypothetical protein